MVLERSRAPPARAHRHAGGLAQDRRGSARALRWRPRRPGLALGLVTNGDAGMQREKIVRWDLARFFDVVVIEGEFGCGKPDARVYRHALETLGAHPRDAWMVGDHLVWDVLGAKQVGVSAAWLDRSRQGLPADAPVVPDRIFGALAAPPPPEGPRAPPPRSARVRGRSIGAPAESPLWRGR